MAPTLQTDRSPLHVASVMGLAREAVSSAMPRVLREVMHQDVSLALWKRTLPAGVAHATAGIRALMPVHQLFALEPGAPVRDSLDEALKHFPGLSDDGARAWCDDLIRLVTLARAIEPAAPVRVRLETKANDACRRFHADSVPLRLICTYRGAGTQWLPGHAVDRACLGCGGDDHVLDPHAAREISTGAVAVMKGLDFPGGRQRALVHRSPPANAAHPRVVAVIDILL